MTEDEAREKWCPEVQYVMTSDDEGIGDSIETKTTSYPMNRLGKTNETTRQHADWQCFKCIASDCMMWRWGPVDVTRGYCGLAGKP